MRRDELLSLKWQDVDLEKCEIRFQNTKTRDWEKAYILEDMAEILKYHLEAQLRANMVGSRFVFPDERSEPLSPRQLVKGWDAILEQAGLPRISFHDLRAPGVVKTYTTLSKKGNE